MGHAIDPRSRSGDAAPAALDGISILAVRKDTTGALDPNGDVTPIQVDSDGALKVTGGGGSLQYTVDTPSTGIESGTVILAVRNDAGGSLVSANNDLSSMQVDANGALRVLPATHAVTQSGTWNVGSVTTLPALPTGTNAIGSVGVTSLPALPTGTNAIGSVGVTGTVTVSLGAALPTGSNVIGAVTQSGTWNVGSITTLPALPTGTNAIGAVTQSGTWNVGSITTLPALPTGTNAIGSVGVTSLPALPTGSNAIGSVGVTSLPSLPTGSNAIGSVGVTGTVTATIGTALPTGTNVIGGVTQSGTWNVGSITTLPALAAGTADIGAVKQTHKPTPYKLISAATTNATSVSATANTLLYGYYISNTNAAVRYVKFYNKASAPTVGTDVPVLTLAIPASGAANVSFPAGVNFTTGLAFATTTGAADTDTAAVAATEVIVNLAYATY